MSEAIESRRCGQCEFFVRNPKAALQGDFRQGSCHRAPPQVIVIQGAPQEVAGKMIPSCNIQGMYPPVNTTTISCGEFVQVADEVKTVGEQQPK